MKPIVLNRLSLYGLILNQPRYFILIDLNSDFNNLFPYIDYFQIQHVFIMTDFAGRIDQQMSQINTLFKRPLPEDVNVYLKSDDTLAWLLCPGHHNIQIPQELVTEKMWCGYIPMNGSCGVTTKGLKYDLSMLFFFRFDHFIFKTNVVFQLITIQ